MKSLKLAIFLLIFLGLFNLAELTCETLSTPNSESDCHSRQFSTLETNQGAYKCCYLEVDFGGITRKSCVAITKNEYDNIDDYIDKDEDSYDKYDIDVDVEDLDCKSKYLQSALLLLLFIYL